MPYQFEVWYVNSSGLETKWGAARYDTPQEAQDEIISMKANGLANLKPRIKKIEVSTSDLWKQREERRFVSGEYIYISRMSINDREYERIFEAQYPHLSRKFPGKIAFTPNNEYGEADKKKTMSAGRWYKKNFPHLSDDVIAKNAAECGILSGEVEIKFATTEDDIEWVYTHGPSSCMSYRAGDFSSPFHPTRVYAAGDLALAYIMRGENKEEGRVIARSLVWPEKKIFGRVYGDGGPYHKVMKEGLLALGYQDGDEGGDFFTGARLQRHIHTINDTKYYVIPYIDWISHAHDDGKFIRLGRSDKYKSFQCQYTSGLNVNEDDIGDVNSWYCDRCGDGQSDDDDCYSMSYNTPWCQNCYENYGFTCDWCGEAHDASNMVSLDNHTICEDCSKEVEECSDHSILVKKNETCSECKREAEKNQPELPLHDHAVDHGEQLMTIRVEE